MTDHSEPPTWLIVTGIIVALGVIFVLGVGYGQQWGDDFGGMAEWQYTPGWGNLFTVTVATAAIIASVIVSKITLNRNATQFEQTRLDKRNDKLRAEISTLISTLSERRDRQTVFNKRINDAAHKLASPDADPAAQNAALERFAVEARAIFAEQISPAYQKSMTHAFEIIMLTDDVGLLEPLIRIQEALKAERASSRRQCRSLTKQPGARRSLPKTINKSHNGGRLLRRGLRKTSSLPQVF
jgi:hypothetical protein